MTFSTFVPGFKKIDISCKSYVKPYLFSKMKEVLTSVSPGTGAVSYVSDYRSSGSKFDPGPVPFIS